MIFIKKSKTHKNTYIAKLAFVLVLVTALQSFAVTDRAHAASTSELTATIHSTSYVVLTWEDNLDDNIRYILDKRVDSESYDSTRLSANSEIYYDSDVSSGHTYTYRLRVVDTDSNIYVYAKEISFCTTDLEEPDSLTITPKSSDQIDLKWTYPDKKTYNTIIERRNEDSKTWTEIANVGIGQNTYSDKNVNSGDQYYYKIRAYSTDNVRTTAYPDEDTGDGTYTMLDAPTDLYGYAISKYKIQLNWEDNSAETAFIIERKSPGKSKFEEIDVVTSNKTSYVDQVPEADAVYIYRIKAVTGSASSEYSDEVSITSKYLRTPTELTSSCVDGQSVYLTWEDLTDAETGFEIWRKEGASGDWELYSSMGRNATTFTDLSVTSSINYFYKIRADINDNSVYSDFSDVSTIWISTISAAANLSYEILNKSTIKLTWQDTSGVEAGFVVQRKKGFDGKWYDISFLDPDTTSYSDKWISDENNIYYYRIKTYDKSDAISYSNEIAASIKIPEAPTNLQAEPVSSNEILLTWEDNSDSENEFVIEAMQFYTFKEIGRVSADITTFLHKNIDSQVAFTYRVRAVNGSNESTNSNEASASAVKKIAFTDLNKVAWATTAIYSLSSRDVFDISSNLKFNPQQTITRGEFCAIVIRSLELEEVSAGRYADVTSKHRYYNEIMSAAKLGMVLPDTQNKIYPDKTITREQAGIILTKALKAKGTPLPETNSSILKQFADYKSISDSSANNISAVCGSGIISGRTINGKAYLQLTGSVTRAEASVMVYKALNLQ